MAVKQQQLLFTELRDNFARRLTNHLNNVFVHQVTNTKTNTEKSLYRFSWLIFRNAGWMGY